MIFFILMLVILNWVGATPLIPDLKCHVANNTVYVQITLNATISANTRVVLKTNESHTHKLKTHQCQVSADRKVVNCSVWTGKNGRDIADNDYYSPYQMSVVAEGNSTVFWSRNIGELNQLMYDCFENHKIEDLKITCGDCVSKHHVASNARDTQCRHLQWQRQKHDIDFELIHHHTINIGNREVTNNVDCEVLRTLCVYHNLHNLDECDPEEVCVNTFFKPAYNRTERPKLQQCISTRTMCNRNKCNRDQSTSHLRLVISISLSTAGLIMLALAGVVVHRRYKRRLTTDKRPVDNDDGDDEDVVMPRGAAGGSANDGLYPRNDHDYAYPNFVIPDPDYTEFVPPDLDLVPPETDSLPSFVDFVPSFMHPGGDLVHPKTEMCDALSEGSDSYELGSANTLLKVSDF